MTIAQIQSPNEDAVDLVELARALPLEKRRILSAELASRVDAPHGLIAFLSRDEIDVAEPVILQSSVLNEEDFDAIAKFGSPAHIARLRRRSDLPQKIRNRLDVQCRAEKELIDELRAGNKQAFCAILSAYAGKSASSTLDALEKGDGGPLAGICKNVGLSRAAYSAIVLLSNTARAPETTETLLSIDETDTTNVAL